MSAFVVTEDCLNRSVWAMVAWKNNGRISYHWPTCEGTFRGHGEPLGPSQADTIGREMYDLNLRAVAARYREGIDHHPEGLENTFKFDFMKKVSPMSALKALQCVIYQCSEGEALESSAVYQKMRAAELRLANMILEDMPEYQAAAWG